MKHHYHSTAEKRPRIIIQTSIRGSVSLRTTDNKLVDHDKTLSSMSVPRHHPKVSKKTSIAPVADEEFRRKINSINSIEFDPGHQHPVETTSKEKLQRNIIKINNLSRNSLHQRTHLSNLIGKGAQSDQKPDHANLYASGSIKKSEIQNTTLNSRAIQINNLNDAKMSDIQLAQSDLVNNHRRKSRRKFDRKYLAAHCCSCSPLPMIASVFAGLLLGAAIAALITALMVKNKVTTTTTTTTATTTTTTTVTTTTTTAPILSVGVNDTLQGLWDTIAGGDSSLATPGHDIGNYVPAEDPRNAFDRVFTDKYLSFGPCNDSSTSSSAVCGLNTGFYVTLQQGASVIKELRFFTGNDNPSRDPITMTMEGSNQTGTSLMFGASWTLIYNGSCGLDVNPGRSVPGQTQSFSYNNIGYQSYRLLITSKRSITYAVQYGEVELLGS